MRFLNFYFFVSILLSFSTSAQTVAEVNPILDTYSKGMETDTTKQSVEPIDGIRTEIKSKKTGAKKADHAYRNLGFKASVDEYIKDMNPERMNKESILRVANSFRLNSQTEEAEYWYSNIITEDSKPTDMLRYAQVLQSNGKCEDATRWYKEFNKKASRKEKRNRELVIDCEYLKNIKDYKKVKLENVKALNTGHLDFSPTPYQDGIIFSSTRKNSKPKEVIDSWTNDNFSDLFYAEYDENTRKYKTPKALKGDLNKKFHEGVATFDQSGTVMFFTRNNNNGKSKSKDGLIDLKIYSAVLEDGYWTQVKELPLNSNEFTSCHPTLSSDGRRLYFASNRPGGYGGLDIYVVEKRGGMWSEAKNLGPIVNSAGNELFPTIHEDETLYYSSNGHQGIGGLDIFHAKKTNPTDEYSWGIRENLGTPFNSLKDDFGFVIIGDDTRTGYLTSNRDGGKGKDDIYTWTMDGEFMEDGPMKKTICIYDEKTGKRVRNAHIKITEVVREMEEENENLMLTLEPLDDKKDKFILGVTGKNKKRKKVAIANFETDTEGVFTYTAMPNTEYQFTVNKDGYDEKIMEVSYLDLKLDNEYCLPVKKRNCKIMTTTVVNKAYDSAMPLAEVEVWNKCTNQKEKYSTDETGSFEICVPCGCEFRVYATKSGFDSATDFFSTLEEACKSEDAIKMKLELDLRKTQVTTSAPASNNIDYNAPAVRTVPVTTYEEVITYVPKRELVPVTTYVPITDLVNSNNANLSEGQVISLKDIYYNFDKFDIREDASLDLNHVLTLLQKYPSLEIELMSHTDSRGTNEYNVWLSSERAKAARQFLIKKGIAAHRVTAAGYGELQLKNKCADGVICTEVEHQQNRRTEVKVTKFSEVNVQMD